MPSSWAWESWERAPYLDHLERMTRRLEDRIADRIPDTWIFAEHEPVVTRGRGLQYTKGRSERSRPVDSALLAGIPLVDLPRGGDLTYHGPGQLILYPIVKLDGTGAFPRHDLGGLLRHLEQSVVDLLSTFGVNAFIKKGAAGVWVTGLTTGVGGDRKIASLGVAAKRWVTYHGIALNVRMDLGPFERFSPCGFDGKIMTQLSELLLSRSESETPSDSLKLLNQEWPLLRAQLEERWKLEILRALSFS